MMASGTSAESAHARSGSADSQASTACSTSDPRMTHIIERTQALEKIMHMAALHQQAARAVAIAMKPDERKYLEHYMQELNDFLLQATMCSQELHAQLEDWVFSEQTTITLVCLEEKWPEIKTIGDSLLKNGVEVLPSSDEEGQFHSKEAQGSGDNNPAVGVEEDYFAPTQGSCRSETPMDPEEDLLDLNRSETPMDPEEDLRDLDRSETPEELQDHQHKHDVVPSDSPDQTAFPEVAESQLGDAQPPLPPRRKRKRHKMY